MASMCAMLPDGPMGWFLCGRGSLQAALRYRRLGGVAANGAVGQRGRAALVVHAAATPGGGGAGDGQAAEVGRHATVHQEHPAQPTAADRHARGRYRPATAARPTQRRSFEPVRLMLLVRPW